MHSPDGTPKGVGCPIRTSTDQRPLAAPRGFSQRATSFIASWCQGIHRMPFSRSTHPPCTGTIHAPQHGRGHTRPTAGRNPTHTPGTPEAAPTLSNAPEHSRPIRRGIHPCHDGTRGHPVRRKHRTRRRTHPGPHPRPPERTRRKGGGDTPRRPARPGTHQNPIHLSKDHTRPTRRHHTDPAHRPTPWRRPHRSPNSHRDPDRTGGGARKAPPPRSRGRTPRDDAPARSHARPRIAAHGVAAHGWRRPGSNRRPPACKAGALPAELRPHTRRGGRAGMGQGGLEPPTPRLSSVCSDQLSY